MKKQVSKGSNVHHSLKKNIFPTALAIAVFTFLICISPLQAADMRIYLIGNSLTEEVKPKPFENMVQSQGRQITLGYHFLGGSRIYDIWQKPDFAHGTKEPFGLYKNALVNYQWDVMTLQPFYYPFEPQYEDAIKFSQLLMKKSPDAQIYIYSQWPQKVEGPDWYKGYTRAQETPTYFKTEPPFQYNELLKQLPKPLAEKYKDRSLRSQYEVMVYGLRLKNVSKKPALLIPVGDVILLLGEKMKAGLMPGYNNPYDFYSDEVHVNNDGSYIVACTYYATIYKTSPIGLPFSGYQGQPASRDDHVKITPELAKIIQETVWEVVATNPLTGVTSKEPVKVASPLLDHAVVGEEYFYALIPAFGVGPYKWSIAKGGIAQRNHSLRRRHHARRGRNRRSHEYYFPNHRFKR